MIPDLPEELETEILSRVPAKSLAKLKTICKRWYALFKDPIFVKKNFSKSLSEDVIIQMNSGVYPISLSLDSLQNKIVPATELTGKLIRLEYSNFKIAEIFHCAGLLLCVGINNSGIVVWNPCTGKTRWVNPRMCHERDDSYDLGYKNNDSSCFHNYKILRYSKNRLDFIYDFSSDSWRIVKDVTGGRNCIIKCHGVSLKGNAYWFATDEKDPMGKFILMFDFTKERFVRLRLPLPFYSDYYYSKESVALSVVGEDTLALLHQGLDPMGSYDIKIWKTDTKLDDAKEFSWIDLTSANFSNLWIPIFAPSFLWDEDNQVVVCCDIDMENNHRVIIYIVGEEIHKTIYLEVTPGTSRTWPFLFNYVPHLIHIPKRQKKRKRAPRW